MYSNCRQQKYSLLYSQHSALYNGVNVRLTNLKDRKTDRVPPFLLSFLPLCLGKLNSIKLNVTIMLSKIFQGC